MKKNITIHTGPAIHRISQSDQRQFMAETEKPEILVKQEAVRTDHNLEHELTVKYLFRKHPALIWWCFFWGMAAVGW